MRFLMVDRLIEVQPWQHARGIKAVAGSEDFFAEHFPGNPVLPGVLILEALAQTAGALVNASSDCETFALMTLIEGAKFRSHARPGDVLELDVTIDARDRTTARVSGRAFVHSREIASAQLAFVLLPLAQVIGAGYVEFWRGLVRSLTSGLELDTGTS